MSHFGRIFVSSVRNAVAHSKTAPSFESIIHRHQMAGSSHAPPPQASAPSCLFRGISAELSNWEQNLNFRASSEILKAECGLKSTFTRGYCCFLKEMMLQSPCWLPADAGTPLRMQALITAVALKSLYETCPSTASRYRGCIFFRVVLVLLDGRNQPGLIIFCSTFRLPTQQLKNHPNVSTAIYW